MQGQRRYDGLRRWLAVVLTTALAATGMSVVPASSANASSQYPLSFSANGRYFVDADGAPFLYMADTAWWALERLTTAEYGLYLDDRRSKGFNAIQIMAPYDSDANNYYGEAPFTTQGVLSTPNPAWWARLDTFVAAAASRGMVVNIATMWLGTSQQQWWTPIMNNSLTDTYNFGLFLGNRYKNSQNVIWTIGGDFNPGTRKSRLEQVAAGIRAGNTVSTAIITASVREGQSAVDQYPTSSWLNLNATYTYMPEWNNDIHVYAQSKTDYNRPTTAPFILIESAYENFPLNVITPTSTVRRAAYWSILSGSTGTAYGNRNVWCFGDSTGLCNADWKQAINDPGAYQMQNLTAVFRSRAWYSLIPDFSQSVVTSGFGTFNASGASTGGDDYVTAARNSAGTLVMAYIPSTGTGARSITVNLASMSLPTFGAKWYNPANGVYVPIGNFSNSGSQVFTTPGYNGDNANDWLLILEPGSVGNAAPIYSDAFTSATLSSQWSFVRENSAKWSLAATPGRMRITTETGDLNSASNNAKNLLLQSAPPGDWTFDTKLDFGKPAQNFQQAGIVLYQDDDNYIKLVRAFAGANIFVAEQEVAGSAAAATSADGIAGATVYLRLVKAGNSYTAFTSSNGTSFTQVGGTMTNGFSNLRIGLLAANGGVTATPLDASFDYVQVASSQVAFSDEFSSTTLGSQWTVLRPEASSWSLSTAPGRLRIASKFGDLNTTANNVRNLFVQAAPAGDWTVVSKIDFGPGSQNFQQAGLVVYQDDGNYFKLVRAYAGARYFVLEDELAGTASSSVSADTIGAATAYLKVVKSGSNYTAYFSSNGTSYTQVGGTLSRSYSNLKIGLIVGNGAQAASSLNADIDYFRVTQ